MMRNFRIKLSSLGFKQARRLIVFVVGMTVLLFGVALLVLPGPAILVIPAGLAILGLEFRWARRWLRQGRVALRNGRARVMRINRQEQGSKWRKEGPDDAVEGPRNTSSKPEPLLK